MTKPRKYIPDEDASLLTSMRQGDIGSFETLVRTHQKNMFNISFQITGDYEGAFAAVQSAFVIAYFDINSLRSTTRFSTWLTALTIRETRNLFELRQSLLEPASSQSNGDLKVTDDPGLLKATKSPGLYDQTDLHERLRGYITSLPRGLAEVLVLRHLHGYDINRISEIMQLRKDMIKTHLFTAEEHMLACLKHHTTEYSLNHRIDRVHPEIRRNFSSYLDNSAEGGETSEIKYHLRSCGSCREALSELEWILEHLKSLPDVETPYLLLSNIMMSIMSGVNPKEENRHFETKPPLGKKLALGVMILALAAISWYLFSRTHSQERHPESKPAIILKSSPPAASTPVPVDGAPPKPIPAQSPSPSTTVKRSQSPLSPPMPKIPGETDSEETVSRTQQPLPDKTDDAAKAGKQKPIQLPANWEEGLPSGPMTHD
jgi:RNA polymerase sigma-70 factor (ECF subfamily)